MIDASHGNSGKNPENQSLVIEDVSKQIAAGDRRLLGVMLESNLTSGRQDLLPGKPLIYGCSITDGCIDWPTSITLLERLATAVEHRRCSSVGVRTPGKTQQTAESMTRGPTDGEHRPTSRN